MGKGARERKKRKGAGNPPRVARLSPPEALDAILSVEDADAFCELIHSHPEVLSGQVLQWAESTGDLEGFEPTSRALVSLVRDARRDAEGAWLNFQSAMTVAETLASTLEARHAEVEQAMKEGRHDDAIVLIDELLPKTREAGLGVAVCLLHSQRALAFLRRSSGNRAENIEESIAAYRSALPLVISAEQRAEVLMHAGLTYGERVRGDRAENLEQAIELLRQAVAEVERNTAPETWAITQHNLATGLLRRERGDRRANLAEARALCREVMTFRSPERNAEDWAHTQLTLGAILQDLALLDGADTSKAMDAYQAVIAQQERIGEPWVVAYAHYSAGRLCRISAQVSAEEYVDAFETGSPVRDNRPILEQGQDHLRRADALVKDAPDLLLPARIQDELAAILAELRDDDEEAVNLSRAALQTLRPTSSPPDCLKAGYRLGHLLADRRDWEGSAAAFRDAVTAAELSFHARLETGSREREMAGTGNVHRWAAFALASAGHPLEAALTLESGRTRELRRRLGLERVEASRVNELPGDLSDAYRAAVSQLAATPLEEAEPAGRDLQEVLEAIRSIAGFETFGGAAQPADLSAAIEPGWPLIYVAPTPWGTVLLRIGSTNGAAVATAHSLDRPTALDVFLRLMAGDAADDPDLEESGSYFVATGGFGSSDGDPKDGLEQSLPWLGERVARHVLSAADEVGATGITLVPCGPIAAAPIHASPWMEDSHARYLVDDLDIRYAPSAVVAAAALRRARERDGDTPTLVAMADPTQDLRAAVPEVDEIKRHFDSECVTSARGRHATSGFLKRQASLGSHLHLACHGEAGLFGVNAAALRMSDGPVLAGDLTAEIRLRARLVAVSACQSALSDIGRVRDEGLLADEGLSIGTVMLAAGGACAIASLWSVHDLATALLMIKLYEEMFEGGHRPPEALRRAQVWLRDLDASERQSFLDHHPALDAEFRRRSAAGDFLGGPEAQQGRPYAHPDYWAPFIAVGA